MHTAAASSQFLEQLDAVIDERKMLAHPFYQAWNDGKLTLEMLREYAKQYYLQVRYFPTFVSATHAQCDDMDVRQMLLENLIEEEHGPNNHPELWLRFCDALGISREEMHNAKFLSTTRESIRLLREISGRENVAEGLAALYAYESQIPAVATTKIEGLKKFYGIDSEDGLSFFTVHQHADEIHSQVTREALERFCTTEAQRNAALDAAREAADANNLILDGVYEVYCRELHGEAALAA
jgi:pyrroloquinoline-quinone synthase